MADDEKNETTEETAETTPEPEAGATPATVAEETDAAAAPADDEGAAEPAPEEAAEEAPAAAQETAAAGDAATGEVPDTSATADADATAAEPASDTGAAAAADHDVSDPGVTLAAEKKPRSNRHVPRSQRRTRTKTVREKPATRKPITRTPKPESELGRRQERRGVVISDKGDKTIVVKVDLIRSHPRYKKVVRRAVKFHAHDEQNTAGVGDTVRIVETRPLSKTKRWRLAEIVEKAR
jgi:ribosomal protein uS17